MEKIWFIYEGDFISGPFTTRTVMEYLTSGKIHFRSKIWWRGQRDWMLVSEWHKNADAFEKNIHSSEEAIWYAEKEGSTHGPVAKSQLIDLLSSLTNLSKIRIWKKGQEKWATIYQYADLSEELGITRRKHPRAPILGDVIIEKKGINVSAKLSTISIGGIGVLNVFGFNPGDEVQISIRSPLLILPIHAVAKVKHANSTGYSGFEFTGLAADLQTTIQEYVKQFASANTQFIKTVA
jgi:hypothetical protein